MSNVLERLPLPVLLRAQTIAVTLTAALVLLSLVFAVGHVRQRLATSSSHMAAALLAFRVHDELSQSLSILHLRALAVVDERPQGERAALRQVLMGGDAGAAPPELAVPLSLREAATLQATYDLILLDARRLYTQGEIEENMELLGQIEALQRPLDSYLADPRAANFSTLYGALARVEQQARAATPRLVTAASNSDAALQNTVNQGGLVLLAVLLVFSLSLITFVSVLNRRVRAMYASAEAERQQLRETTSHLQHRNNQMNALYTVFTEITDTLSLNYVVSATLREAMRLMDADIVVLRLVKEGELVVLGSLSKDGQPVGDLEPHTLGEDPLGRVAKRGKPLRIDHTNQELLSDRQREDGQRSGIVIPLIIGARVVGTLGVWSAREDAFNEEDERILGMMSSQVATAVVAADTTETSVHRAHHDPLTGLPNRLQLMEDLARDLAPARLSGRRATVAMVDIDHFKHFNDDFGHHVGDVSLQKVAQTLRHSLRETDRVYRYGGEEFVVVFMDAGREDGLALAERLRSAVETTPLTGDQLEPAGPVTISLGLAFYPDDAPDINTLIELADAAMYRAKTRGRNQVVLWEPDILTGAA